MDLWGNIRAVIVHCHRKSLGMILTSFQLCTSTSSISTTVLVVIVLLVLVVILVVLVLLALALLLVLFPVEIWTIWQRLNSFLHISDCHT